MPATRGAQRQLLLLEALISTNAGAVAFVILRHKPTRRRESLGMIGGGVATHAYFCYRQSCSSNLHCAYSAPICFLCATSSLCDAMMPLNSARPWGDDSRLLGPLGVEHELLARFILPTRLMARVGPHSAKDINYRRRMQRRHTLCRDAVIAVRRASGGLLVVTVMARCLQYLRR